MVGHTSASRFMATWLLVGASWFTFHESADACVKWSRVKGAASSLHSTAEKLRKRIECLEEHGQCMQIARQLESATCELYDAIRHDADWPVVNRALRNVQAGNRYFVACVSQSCVLRNDRRVRSELEDFQEDLCKVQEKLHETLERMGGLPPVRPTPWNQPNGIPNQVNYPWIQQQGSMQVHQFGNERGTETWSGDFDTEGRELFQAPQPSPNGFRPMTLPGYSPSGAPQIRVQNNELGKEMLKLVLSRVLQ
jgi:hypothetical protein